MDTIGLAHQTLYADLVQRALDAEFDAEFPENGTFSKQIRDGKSYWYYVGYRPAEGGEPGQRYTTYVGPADDPDITTRAEAFARAKSGYQERRALVSALKSARLPTPDAFAGDVAESLWKAGLFRRRAVLVGTLAFQTYSGLLGVRLPRAQIMTGDIDIAQFHAIAISIDDEPLSLLEALQSVDASFRPVPHVSGSPLPTKFRNAAGFQIDFLTPNTGSDDRQGQPAKMPTLGNVAAEPLRFLDFLITAAVRAVLLHKGGVPVRVPAPERFAVHKLIVSVERRSDGDSAAKAVKDVAQAQLMIEAMTVTRRTVDLGLAYMEAWRRGPGWSRRLSEGRTRLDPKADEYLDDAIAAACAETGDAVADFKLR